MQVQSVGIVGYGHFGTFVVELLERFLPEVALRVYSRQHASDGELYCTIEDVASSDVVVLCGSINSYEAQLQSVTPHLGRETVVVDVATVKKYTNDLMRRYLGERHYVCCHPMFGAESYQKQCGDVSGFRIVLTDSTVPTYVSEAVKKWLSALGFIIVEMTADAHDKLLAETLFMTHLIGQTMATAGFVRTEIDTVSFGYLMQAVESVAHDGQLFQDVYQFNPYCEAVVRRFQEAQASVQRGLLRKRV